MNIQNIFPTPIGHFNDIGFTNRVLPIVNSILDKIDSNILEYQSTYHNIESQNYLKSFDWITSYIEKISYQFIEKIGFTFKHKIEVDTLFASKINNTQNHGRHTHPQNILSGVMYLETTPNCAPLMFEESRDVRYFNNMIKTENNITTNLNTISFNPIAGDIVIFEAWVPHSVPQVKNKGYRKTLVFNIGYK